MARGELMKKLLASYGRDDEFRAVAEQIITEEENKNNRVLARSLRKTLEAGPSQPSRPRALAPLIPFPEAAGDFIELIEPSHNHKDIILSPENIRVFLGLLKEFRRADEVRRRGLPVRSKLLFCGPPGCGKTLCAEIFASELGLPLYLVKIDRLISSYLGETAANVRKIFEFARKQPCVLFFDEFDALDPALWRRFDEVIWFDRPNRRMIERFLRMKFKNVMVAFDPTARAADLEGYSFAEIERVCIQAIKSAIIEKRKEVREGDFREALTDERRRKHRGARLIQDT